MSDEYKGTLTSFEKSNGRKFVSSVVTLYGTRLVDKRGRKFFRGRGSRVTTRNYSNDSPCSKAFHGWKRKEV